MSTLAKLVVKLVTDISEFEAGMKDARLKLETIGKEMAAIGDRMTTTVTLPIVAAGVAALNFASDLEETRNKTNTVFGSMADSVLAMGKTAAETMGMSQNAALTYAGTYGALLKNMGMTEEQSADMAIQLTKLTSDYASFHNLKPEEAFEKIKAGLVGSSEPLLSLGKDLRVANVEAYAAANGLMELDGSMTQQQLALARYGSLFAQSTDEVGDFLKTSEGLANSSRTATGMLEDLAAKFGAELIPVAINFMKAFTPVLQSISNMSPEGKKAIITILGIVAAIGPVLSIGGRLIALFAGIKGLFVAGGALAAIGPWITAVLIPALGTAVAWIGGTLIPAIVAIGWPVFALIAAIGLLVFVIIKFGRQAWETVQLIGQLFGALAQLIGMKLTEAAGTVKEFFNKMGEWINSKVTQWYNAGRNLVSGLVRGVKSFASNLIASVKGVVSDAIEAAKRLLGIHSPSKVMEGFGINMMRGMEQGILGSVSLIENAMQRVTGAMTMTPALQMAGGPAPAQAMSPAQAMMPRGGDTIQVTLQANVSDKIDVEEMAYRVATIIQRRR